MKKNWTRKQVIKSGLAAVTLASSGTFSVGKAMGPKPGPALVRGSKPPNILLIVTDQERSHKSFPSSLSLPGRERLRKAGTTFENFCVNTIPCGPSRSVIYTGQHIQHTLVTDNPSGGPGRRNLDPKKTPTLGKMLQDAGYYTAYKGKWDLTSGARSGHKDYTNVLKPFGFDEYNQFPDTFGSTQQGSTHDPTIINESVRWLPEQAPDIGREKPWFLSVNLINPHDIMFFDATGRQSETRLVPGFISEMAGAPDRAPYDEELGYDLPANFANGQSGELEAHDAYAREADYVYGTMPLDDLTSWRRYQNYYFNCMRDVDRHIETLLDALERSGERESTVIVFTSDHGEMAGAHGQRLKGPFIYKENIEVPCTIVHPDVAGGRISNALACSLDLAPTLLSLASIDNQQQEELYPALKGIDLSNFLVDVEKPDARQNKRGGILINHSSVFATNPDQKKELLQAIISVRNGGDMPSIVFPKDFVQFELRTFYRGIFDGRYKFARYFSPSDHHMPRDWQMLVSRNDLELYDTANDPNEINNLARNPEASQSLIMRLNDRLNQLIEIEVGTDDGAYMPKPPSQWRRT